MVVEYMADTLYVQTARRDVGSYENIYISSAESLYHLHTVTHLHISVKAFGIDSLCLQKLRDTVYFAFHAAEDDRLFGLLSVQKAHYGVVSVFLFYDIVELANILVCRLLLRHRDELGLMKDMAREILYRLRHRRGEEKSLTLLRKVAEYLFYIVQEAHVEHLVGFVENYDRGVEILQFAGAEHIQKPSGGGDNNLCSAAYKIELAPVALSAVYADGSDTGEAAQAEEFVADLCGKFAGRSYDEHIHTASPLYIVECGQTERRRLSRTCMGLAHNIVTFENQGNYLLLYRAGHLKSHTLDRAHDRLFESEIGKTYCRLLFLFALLNGLLFHLKCDSLC